MGPADQTNDAAFSPAIGTNVADLHQHAVAVHGRTHRRRRNKNISRKLCLQAFVQRTGFGNDKAEAIAVHAEPPDCHVFSRGSLGNGIAAGIHFHQLAHCCQVFQSLREHSTIIPTNAEFANQLLETGQAFGLALNFLKNVGIRNHRDGCHSRASLQRVPLQGYLSQPWRVAVFTKLRRKVFLLENPAMVKFVTGNDVSKAPHGNLIVAGHASTSPGCIIESAKQRHRSLAN